MKLKSFTAFLLLAFLASCSGSDKAKNESAKEDNVPTVKVEQVSEQDVDQIQTYTATVEPYLINNISAQMSNRIKAIYVDEGMRVSKGQKLVVLDNVNTDSYQLQISTAQAQLSQLEADLNRAKELYRIGGGTRQQVEQMQTQVTAARNQLATARRALRNAQENLDTIYNRDTTYHTYFELLMSTFEIYDRMIERGIHVDYLDNGFDLEYFLRTIYKRADHMLCGYFYPEYAMYMANPNSILDTFMVRHDGYRVRIDDVQHNVGGYYLYYMNYDKLVDYGMLEYRDKA